LQLAAGDVTTRHRTAADAEYGPHLGFAEGLLHQLRLQQAFHGQLDVFQQLVDHVVVAHIDAGGIGGTFGAWRHRGIEAHDHRTGGGRQVDVGFGYLARSREQHPHLHFALGQSFEGAKDGFHRTLDVGLEDQVELLELALAGLARH